jgi:hypothetical protein
MWISVEAMEDIKNNSICVALNGYESIRNMKYKDDINKNLVFVSNCPIESDEDDNIAIKEGTICRVKKLDIYEHQERNLLL